MPNGLVTVGALLGALLSLSLACGQLWHQARLCIAGREEMVTVVGTHVETTTRRNTRSYLWHDVVIDGVKAKVELKSNVAPGKQVNVLYVPPNPTSAIEKDPEISRFKTVFLRLYGMPLWFPLILLAFGSFAGLVAFFGLQEMVSRPKTTSSNRS